MRQAQWNTVPSSTGWMSPCNPRVCCGPGSSILAPLMMKQPSVLGQDGLHFQNGCVEIRRKGTLMTSIWTD